MSESVSAFRGAGWTLADKLSRKRSVMLRISIGNSSKVLGRLSSGAGVPGSEASCSSSSRFSNTSALESLPKSSAEGSIDLASGIEGIPETCVVLARLRGEEGVDEGESILVKEREGCSCLGLVLPAWAASEDMALFQRWPKRSADDREQCKCDVSRDM